jgi:hypothetical protein
VNFRSKIAVAEEMLIFKAYGDITILPKAVCEFIYKPVVYKRIPVSPKS